MGAPWLWPTAAGDHPGPLTPRVARLSIDRTWDDLPAGCHAQVDVEVTADAVVLRVDAPWHGDPAPPGPPGPTPRLWEHEVVELFLLGADARYLEVELGPHGHHLVLWLDGTRRPVHQGAPLDYRAERRGDRWQGVARIPLAWVPPGCDRLNAYAIHGRGEGRRYLAWRPTLGDQPDFHRLERFARWPD